MAVNRNLTKATKTVVVNTGTVAGQTAINCTSVDTLGFSAYRHIVILGTLTATQVTSVKAQESVDNSVWTDVVAAVTANAADADSNKTLILDIYKPQQRYARAVVQRATANAVVIAVITELWVADFQPTTQDASNSQFKVMDNPV